MNEAVNEAVNEGPKSIRVFETGAKRDVSVGKGRYDKVNPVFLLRMAQRLEPTKPHHTDGNWEKGIPLSSWVDSLLRHINQWHLGDLTEDHLAAAAFNLQGLMVTEAYIQQGILPESLNDVKHPVSLAMDSFYAQRMQPACGSPNEASPDSEESVPLRRGREPVQGVDEGLSGVLGESLLEVRRDSLREDGPTGRPMPYDRSVAPVCEQHLRYIGPHDEGDRE